MTSRIASRTQSARSSRPRIRSSVPIGLLLRGSPAAVMLLGVAVLLLLMLGRGAKLAPAKLQQRADQNMDRQAFAEAAIDYRRLLQQAPANAHYRENLKIALSLRSPTARP